MISYAQNFEDVMLWRALGHLKDGFYIDVGANDPEVDSVTKAFYLSGWHGINIEPLSSHYADLVRDRPKDINLRCAAGAVNGEMEIWECDVRGWATASLDVVSRHIANGHTGVFRTVPVRTLTDICSQYVSGPIHFMKVDVEGFEKSVIDGMDFARFRPWILVIEATRPNSTEESFLEWEVDVVAAGYALAYRDGLNRFYISNDHPELASSLLYPPNVLDGFIRSEQFNSDLRAQQATAQAAQSEAIAQQATAQAAQSEAIAQQALAQAVEAQSSAQRAIALAMQADIKAEQSLLETTFPRLFKRALTGVVRRLKLSLISIPLFGESSAKPNNKKPLLQRIWVDLTPMLPGGANGGAKPFMLCLLSQLADLHPTAFFHCTCSLEMMEELLPLQRPNMKFTDSVPLSASTPRLGSRLLGKVIHQGMRRLKHKSEARRVSGGSDIQLLFCPFGAPLLHKAGLPIVSTFHDLQFNAYPEFFSTAARQERLEHFRLMLARASRIAAISHFSRDQAIAHGADPGRIKTIHHHMALSRHTSSSKPPFFDLHPGQYFLYPANLWRHKNHELLLTAYAMARSQGLPAELKLVCTGDGGDRLVTLRVLAKDLGLGETVILPGFVSDEDLESLYQHALAIVFPSLYEGFGLPIIEAMARGLPVACSATTALVEVAGDAALFFHPGNPQQIADALRQLAEDSFLRQHLIALGTKQAESYANPGVMANQYWELFQEAFAKGRYS